MGWHISTEPTLTFLLFDDSNHSQAADNFSTVTGADCGTFVKHPCLHLFFLTIAPRGAVVVRSSQSRLSPNTSNGFRMVFSGPMLVAPSADALDAQVQSVAH